jgi:hypothetical protein
LAQLRAEFQEKNEKLEAAFSTVQRAHDEKLREHRETIRRAEAEKKASQDQRDLIALETRKLQKMKSIHDEKEKQLENMDAGSGFMSTASNNAVVPKLVNTTPSTAINFEPATSTRSNGSSQLGGKRKAADFYFKKQSSTVQQKLSVKTDFMTQEIKPAAQTTRDMK